MKRLNQILTLENQKVGWLILLSFGTGLFLSHYFTFANGFFLQQFSSDSLWMGYMLSGLTGLLISRLYAWVKNRVSQSRLYFFTLLFLLICGLSILGVYELTHHGKASVLIAFSLISSFYTLVGLQFWGLSFELFGVRSGVFAKIGVGGVLASVTGFGLITLYHEQSYLILTVGSCGLILALIAQQIILKFYTKKSTIHKGGVQTVSSKSLFKNKLAISLFAITIISVFIQYIIDYNFLVGVNNHLNDKEQASVKDMPLFIAQVFITIRLFELGLRFMSNHIVKAFSLKIVLLGLPALFFLIHAIMLGAEMANLHVLFYLILSSKIIDRSVRSGLDEPARKQLFQSMETGTRTAAQVLIDGYAKQIAITIAGGIIFLLSYLEVGIQLPIIIIIILSLAWLISSGISFKAYADQLQRLLSLPTNEERAQKKEKLQTEELVHVVEQSDELSDHEKALLMKGLNNQSNRKDYGWIIRHWYLRENDHQVKMKLINMAIHFNLQGLLLEILLKDRFDIRIVNALVPYFKSDRFHCSEEHIPYFNVVLEKCLRNIVWLGSMVIKLHRSGSTYRGLTDRLRVEIKNRLDLLFDILSIKKEYNNLDAIKYHLLGNSTESNKQIAIQLLEILLDDSDDTKKNVITVLEGNQKELRAKDWEITRNGHAILEEIVFADHFKIELATKRVAFGVICDKFHGTYGTMIEGFLNHSDQQIQFLARKHHKLAAVR